MGLKVFLDKALDRPRNGDKVEYFGEVKKKCNGYVLVILTVVVGNAHHGNIQ